MVHFIILEIFTFFFLLVIQIMHENSDTEIYKNDLNKKCHHQTTDNLTNQMLSTSKVVFFFKFF